MKTRTAWLILPFLCGLLLSGCSRITEMDADVTYKSILAGDAFDLARVEVESLYPQRLLEHFSNPLTEEALKAMASANGISPTELLNRLEEDGLVDQQLGWMSIHNPTQRDWVGVGVVLTSPNLKHNVEPYVGMVEREGLGKTARMFYTAPVEFRYVCNEIEAGETVLVALSGFSPAVTASRMIAPSQSPWSKTDSLTAMQSALRDALGMVPELEPLQTQLVQDIAASRVAARVVVGIGTDSSQRNDFLTNNIVGSKK